MHSVVELRERHPLDAFVGQAQPLEHRDRRVWVEMLEQRELHVGEHERMVALRDEHRAGELDRVDRTRVDDAPLTRHRVDPDARPRELREREPGHDVELDPPLAQQDDSAFGDRGVAGDCVRGAMLRGGVDEQRDHLRVGRLEIGRGVVDVIERREGHPLGFELGDRRMTAGPHEAHGCRLERVARGGQQVVGPRGSEPDDGEAGHATTAAGGKTETAWAQPGRGHTPSFFGSQVP